MNFNNLPQNKPQLSSHHNTNSKGRSKSFATALVQFQNYNQSRTEEKTPPSPDPDDSMNLSFRFRPKSRNSTSFTQIPGPIPSHNHNHNHNHNHFQLGHGRKRMASSSTPYFRAKSQNSSPRGHHSLQLLNSSKHSYSRSTNSSPRYSQRNGKNGKNSNHSHPKRARFSANDMKPNHNGKNGKKGNYLESVTVLKIIETRICKLIEIITENDFRIRCTSTHLFWLCGKGWGCYDSRSRINNQKKIAMMNHANGKKRAKIPDIIYELKPGAQLLTIGGNKYRISHIRSMDKPDGINVYSIIVDKNDCFFANDLLVKNAI